MARGVYQTVKIRGWCAIIYHLYVIRLFPALTSTQ